MPARQLAVALLESKEVADETEVEDDNDDKEEDKSFMIEWN